MLGGEDGPACSRTAPRHLQKPPLEYAAELAPELAPGLAPAWHGGAVREARGRGRRSASRAPWVDAGAGWQRKAGCLCSVVPPIAIAFEMQAAKGVFALLLRSGVSCAAKIPNRLGHFLGAASEAAS